MATWYKQWQEITRDDHVQEHFMIGEFINADTWESSQPPEFTPNTYPYLNDYIRFNGVNYTSPVRNDISVSEIIHVTSYETALSIIKNGGFKPGRKYIPGIGQQNLVWFGLKVDEAGIDSVRQNYIRFAHTLRQDISPENADRISSHVANTAPFQPMSRYGNVKFTLSIRNVLDAYQEQFCKGWPAPEIRKLGTFAYKHETMHVILVCPPGNPTYYECPLLLDDLIIEPDINMERWTWFAQCTAQRAAAIGLSGNVHASCYKRWEHVTFAFVLPEGQCLNIFGLNDHVSLCLHEKLQKKYTPINNVIANMFNLIIEEQQKLANLLKQMIHGYREELPLYENTVTVPEGTLDINEEKLQQMFEQIDKDTLSMLLADLTL